MNKNGNQASYYLFGSKILTHAVFWIAYYLLFSLIWSNEYGLKASFYLELILLPARMLAVYTTIYYLLPQFLLRKKHLYFLTSLVALLLVCAILQRVFIHLFYEEILTQQNKDFWDFAALLKASMLINTTVLLAMCIKLLGTIEYQKVEKSKNKQIAVKSNRKIHLLDIDSIIYLEGLGNYINYYLKDGSKITSYNSLKKAIHQLPDHFLRCHKSYVINKIHLTSYDQEVIEVNISGNTQEIPRSKSFDDALLMN